MTVRPEFVQRKEQAIHWIEHTLIEPNTLQPRQFFPPEAITRLANSLKAKGCLVPLRVQRDEGRGRYIIVSGETRWRAAKEAGIGELPCLIVDGLDEAAMIEDQVTDNNLHRTLTPIETAKAIEKLKLLTGKSSKAIAERLGLNPSEITTYEALLTLPAEMQESVNEGKVPLTSGYHLARCESSAVRMEIYQAIVDGRLTRDQTKKAVAKSLGGTRTYTKSEGKPKPVVLNGEGGAVLRIEPGTSPEELYTLAGRVFRAAEAAKKANDITLFKGRLA